MTGPAQSKYISSLDIDKYRTFKVNTYKYNRSTETRIALIYQVIHNNLIKIVSTFR